MRLATAEWESAASEAAVQLVCCDGRWGWPSRYARWYLQSRHERFFVYFRLCMQTNRTTTGRQGDVRTQRPEESNATHLEPNDLLHFLSIFPSLWFSLVIQTQPIYALNYSTRWLCGRLTIHLNFPVARCSQHGLALINLINNFRRRDWANTKAM